MLRHRLLNFLGVVVFAALAMGQAKKADPLFAARQAYNDQRFDEAIRAAETARALPDVADAAAVILARAHLERFRAGRVTGDLLAARTALKGVDASQLSPRDQVEFLTGLGVSVYLDDQYTLDDRYAAAAEFFDIALARADVLDAASRDRLFEWWASSLDQQAQQGAATARRQVYERVVRRAESELARADAGPASTYWLAAAARGIDDLPRAWAAAVAGWTRATSFGPRANALRADLDRLMTTVVLPERARQLTSGGGDPRPALALLSAQWADFKQKWAR